MHPQATFPSVSITVHGHDSPILAQKESKAGLALGPPRLWFQYPEVRWLHLRFSCTESAPLPPLECPTVDSNTH